MNYRGWFWESTQMSEVLKNDSLNSNTLLANLKSYPNLARMICSNRMRLLASLLHTASDSTNMCRCLSVQESDSLNLHNSLAISIELHKSGKDHLVHLVSVSRINGQPQAIMKTYTDVSVCKRALVWIHIPFGNSAGLHKSGKDEAGSRMWLPPLLVHLISISRIDVRPWAILKIYRCASVSEDESLNSHTSLAILLGYTNLTRTRLVVECNCQHRWHIWWWYLEQMRSHEWSENLRRCVTVRRQ